MAIVTYLDSQKLLDAANTLDACIADYVDLVKRISQETQALLNEWHGKGKEEFDKDYTTIYRQLSDISDVMYELYDALVDADATYVQTDEDIAKGITIDS